MADHMGAELVIDALHMALARRRPGSCLIHHSDQGSQFVSLRLLPAGPRRRHGGLDGIARRLPLITPSLRASSPTSRGRSSTGAHGRRSASSSPRSSATSTPSTTPIRHSTPGYLSPAQSSFALRNQDNDIERSNDLTNRVRRNGGTPNHVNLGSHRHKPSSARSSATTAWATHPRVPPTRHLMCDTTNGALQGLQRAKLHHLRDWCRAVCAPTSRRRCNVYVLSFRPVQLGVVVA